MKTLRRGDALAERLGDPSERQFSSVCPLPNSHSFLKSARGIFIRFRAECAAAAAAALIASLSPAQGGGKPRRALAFHLSIPPSIHSNHPHLPTHPSVLLPSRRPSISPEEKVLSAHWSKHCDRCVARPAQCCAFPASHIGAIPGNPQGDSHAPSA